MATAAIVQAEDPGAERRKLLRRMSPELIKEICKERSMWSQPHLNTQLYLNYKGFETIEGLEAYINIRALYLGSNNIAKIDGLDRMSDLRTLHLEGNRIRSIENLSSNLELRQLNLESNAIRHLANLSHLTKLQHLNLAKNALASLADLEELKSLPSLENLDVSHNCIEETEGVIEFWADLPAELKILRYHGNPGVRFIEHYRKRLVNALASLRYLDERPIFPVERKSSAAWAEGGLQALQQAKRDHFQEQVRLQNAVEPDRREFLTQQRKLAIARIEREERERQEQEEKQEKEWTAVQRGDPAAVDDYTKAWRDKLQKYGAEQLRDEAAATAGVQDTRTNGRANPAAEAALAEAQRKAQVEKNRLSAYQSKQGKALTFAPPSREHGRPTEAPPAARASNVADFRQSGAGELDWSDRQFSVLSETDAPNIEEDEAAALQMKVKPEQEIVPDLWRNMEKENKEAESKVHEMHAKLCEAEPKVMKSKGATELGDLD
ncbi:unnamed protein product [Durusdinium trenchii]|uniref:Dynein assembly factor 1, axonemal homolog n=1 Tax=Durusdinium trenchii TaxID=1381693 RepID=A0ABP0PTY1_9DINO